ncbi:MAG: molybdenum cofactor guanylyltransferase, partial [Desulfocucumaceae bacterium]
MQVSGIILAGGKSNRMGRNKALLKIGSLTLIERVARVLSAVCPEIVIVGGSAADFGHLGYPVIPDIYPGCGPLSGIHAGLSAIKNEYGFVSACDIPFINKNLIRRIISRAEGHDAVIVMHGDYFEPLFSLYSKTFARAAET